MILTFTFIIVTAAGYAASVILGSKKKKEDVNQQKGCFAVEYPKSPLVVAAILEVIALAGDYYIRNDATIKEGNTIFIQSGCFLGILAIIIVYLCFRTNRFRVIFEDDNITVYPAFGAAYTATMDDITSVQRKGSTLNRKETIDVKFKNGRLLHTVSTMSSYNVLLAKLSGYTIK